MQAKTRDLLNQVTTATLTMQLLKRGLRRCYMPGVHRLDATMGRIVGPLIRCATCPTVRIAIRWPRSVPPTTPPAAP